MQLHHMKSGLKLNRRRNHGFTLLELLVVMVIIGLLAAIGIGGLISSQQKGRDARRKQDLESIKTALEVYYNDYGFYPQSSADGRIAGCGANADQPCDWGGPFQAAATYMVQLPQDPVDGKQYYYFYNDSNKSYQLYAELENKKDKDLQHYGKDADSGQVMIYDTACGGSACDCGEGSGSICNYGIGSSNVPMPTPNATATEIDPSSIPEIPLD
jgi:general secretion pathway protein G